MKPNAFRILFFFAVLQLFSCKQQEIDLLSFKTNVLQSETLSIDQKVARLLDQMTLEEKIGQMNQYSGFWDFTGPAPRGGRCCHKNGPRS